jgi:hypothetical protein
MICTAVEKSKVGKGDKECVCVCVYVCMFAFYYRGFRKSLPKMRDRPA